jgi:uncharacterized protein (DUF58 family)
VSLTKFYLSFYLSGRSYLYGGAVSLLFVASFFFAPLAVIARLSGIVWLCCVILDAVLLYAGRGRFHAQRTLPGRLSNGDLNEVGLEINNEYPFGVRALVIDELPVQFQERNWQRRGGIPGGGTMKLSYQVHPKERGEYVFGRLHVFILSPLGLVQRRYSFGETHTVPVYPSFLQLRGYQLKTIAGSEDAGLKRLRRTGRSLEFEQIKEYVPGDDYRTINWKASARKGGVMINTYVEERSQHIYCVLDKGRLMKMPFEGMTLLDYAINASLVLINVALQREDKAGLITFSKKIDQFLPAERKASQMETVMEALYKQETGFKESDFEYLYAQIRSRIKQRSLLILFTNFESIHSMRRQLPYLRAIGRYHLLLTVFFDNTELHALQEQKANNLEDIYVKTIADRFLYEKKLMAKELAQFGILSVFTSPENLTVQTVNKYLEIKARQAL